ncbi:hypothetical protein A3758_04260 [Oleiphilus sp. HI0118]|nr:hypothetical protein A3758_04260 [Oleiphilus sp. HI0118]KZZ75560.1 hypothetical protein A3767_21630 [Oleiphilus sp. HI0133]KZZ80883.1 hypothetical protein A3767_09125 [Oleiphilus sp. HI0133]
MPELNLLKDYDAINGTVTAIDWANRLGITRAAFHRASQLGGIPEASCVPSGIRRWNRAVMEMFCDGILRRNSEDGHWYNRLNGNLVAFGSDPEGAEQRRALNAERCAKARAAGAIT